MASKAFMKLKGDLGTSFKQDILTTLRLVDTMIKPILLFNSDFWGCMKLHKGNPIENLDMMICMSILGVHKMHNKCWCVTGNWGEYLYSSVPLKIR